jgi:hypothetical protein
MDKEESALQLVVLLLKKHPIYTLAFIALALYGLSMVIFFYR